MIRIGALAVRLSTILQPRPNWRFYQMIHAVRRMPRFVFPTRWAARSILERLTRRDQKCRALLAQIAVRLSVWGMIHIAKRPRPLNRQNFRFTLILRLDRRFN